MSKIIEVRDVIRNRLQDLYNDLRYFEKTTHGKLGPSTFESICKALLNAYNEPSAYNISNLSQDINAFFTEN